MNLFLKVGNGKVVEDLFLKKMIRDLLELRHLLKFAMKT